MSHVKVSLVWLCFTQLFFADQPCRLTRPLSSYPNLMRMWTNDKEPSQHVQNPGPWLLNRQVVFRPMCLCAFHKRNPPAELRVSSMSLNLTKPFSRPKPGALIWPFVLDQAPQKLQCFTGEMHADVLPFSLWLSLTCRKMRVWNVVSHFLPTM